MYVIIASPTMKLFPLTHGISDLQGWHLDKIAADPKKKATAEESDTDEEDIPWACYICRKPYTDPVRTRIP
jgi:hypothetical protein